MKYFYFNTTEEINEWVKKKMKKLKYSTAIAIDRTTLFPEEIESYFGTHTERYVVSAHRR